MTKKRYVGIDENGDLHATGIEMRRSDWTTLAQKVQEELLKMVLVYDASEEEINNYIESVQNGIRSFPLEDFTFEKIVDCRKKLKARTRIVKVWSSFGYKVEETEYEEDGIKKPQYQCIAPRGEVLIGVRWVYDNKGLPIGIPEDQPLSLFKNKIGYEWYINNQVLPIAERVTKSIDYGLGKKQETLYGEVIYL